MKMHSAAQAEQKPSTLGGMLLRLLIQRLFVPTFILIALTLGVASYMWGRSLGAQQMELARVMANSVETFLQNAENMLRSSARVADLAGEKSLSFYLESSLEGFAYFDTTYRLNKDGIIVQQEPHEPRFMGLDQSRQPYFNKAKSSQGLSISRPFNSIRTGKPTVNLTWPLADRGMMVAELNLGTFQDAVTAARHKQSKSTIIIMDQAGTILAHPHTELIAQQTRIGNLPLLQQTGTGEDTMHYRSETQWVLGSYTRIKSTGWTVLVQAPMAVVYGDMLKAVVPMVLLCLGIWLFVVLTFRQRFWRHVVNPLADLSQTAIAITSGDLERTAKVEKENEIGIVAKAFNSMTAQLRNVISHLEDRVDQLKNAERIAQLGHWDWDIVEDKLVWSDELLRILGYSPGSVEPSYELLKEISMDVAALEKKVADALAGLGTYQFENKIKRPDGTIVYVQNYGEVTFDENRRPVRFFGTSLDITDLKNAQIALQKAHDGLETKILARTAELAEAKEEAESANRSKSDFLARMSHEIRTPLNAIIGLTNIVLKSKLTAEQDDYLNKVQIASDNLLGVINGILDFSKVEAGQLELEEHPFDLDLVMEQLADLFSELIADKHLQLSFKVHPELPNQVTGDSARLTQVLINLVQNAVKFTESGEVVVGAELEELGPEDRSQKTFKFWVSDTGAGIPSDLLPTLFEPFTQAEGYLTRKYEGTGLGLAICQRLVELMGGRIWADSTPGRGSIFYFTVVLKIRKGVPEAVAVRRAQQKAALPIQHLTGCRVLVVEDSELSRDVAVALLEDAGLIVETAENGSIAVDKMAESPRGWFDAVLMDIQMPVMDGYEATRRIREWENQQPGTPKPKPQTRMPIIALTAHALKGEKEKCLATEMDDYLPKPLDERELHRVLLKWTISQQDEAKVSKGL